MAILKIALDGADQGRRFHAGQEMAEEALLRGLERRAGGGFGLSVQRALAAGDVGGLHRSVEVIVDDSEGASIGVVDAALLIGQRVLDQLVFHAVVGERTRSIEPE
jgi:hypothetical protein